MRDVLEIELKVRQEASAVVEKRMMEVLLQFTPIECLRVCDVQAIARFARNAAFEAFSPKTGP